MNTALETIQSSYNQEFGKIEFPMILNDEERREVKFLEAQKAIDRAKFKHSNKHLGDLSGFDICTEYGLNRLIEYCNIDLEAAYDYANRMKHSEINQNIWKKQIDEMEAENESNQAFMRQQLNEMEAEKLKIIHDYWTAEQMYRHMAMNAKEILKKGKKLDYDKDNGHAIAALCYFMSEDERFESKLGYSLDKGIILMGGYGTGKSFLPKLFRGNERNPIQSHSLIRIEHEIRSKGKYEIELSQKDIIYLDDVGTEKDIQKHYGNEVNWFQEWIELMYEDDKPFNRLILSTNLDPDEIEERYTGRVRSRLTEKMNLIVLSGPDRRRE